MFGLSRRDTTRRAAGEVSGPVLDLSGPRLRRALADLVTSAEPTGGVERYVTALSLKASLFEELLVQGQVADLTEAEFLDLAAFVTPVRRKIGAWLATNGFGVMQRALAGLVEQLEDTTRTDARIGAFVACFPDDKAHRWTRDLAAEVLHFARPDLYPLMARWVWDQKVSTGALREVWHGEDVDAAQITVADDYATFDMLRVEIEGFLASEGYYRDLPFFTDLLLSHIYSGYINDRGGQYLRSDFTTAGDPMFHTRRMLGLDAVDTETGRTRLKLIDGTAHVLGGLPELAAPEGHDANS